MNKIKFEISEEEIRKLSNNALTNLQVKRILQTIETDTVLWSDIQSSIEDAIKLVSKDKL